jgi:hypothetical protein
MSSLNLNLKKINKSLENCLNDKIIANVTIAVLAVYAVLIAPNLPYNVALAFDNLYLRMFVMVCIAIICLYDPIQALLMAIGFVLSIQRLYLLKKNRNNSSVAKNVPAPVNNSEPIVNTAPVVNETNNIPMNNSNPVNVVNVANNNKVEQFNNTVANVADLMANNANNTLMAANDNNNLATVSNMVNNKVFVETEEDYEKALNNLNRNNNINDVQPAYNTLSAGFASIQDNLIESCQGVTVASQIGQHDIQGLSNNVTGNNNRGRLATRH